MLDRLEFLFVYVGSAAMVAFLAACISSPTIAVFSCHSVGANGAQRCERDATLAAAAPAVDKATVATEAADSRTTPLATFVSP